MPMMPPVKGAKIENIYQNIRISKFLSYKLFQFKINPLFSQIIQIKIQKKLYKTLYMMINMS